MADFRKFSEKYPFRQRSETPDIAIELSLQPWRTFGVDGVIMFSGINTKNTIAPEDTNCRISFALKIIV